MRKLASCLMIVVLLLSMALIAVSCDNDQTTGTKLLTKATRLRVATTTSLYDTGLWSLLEPKFEEEYEVEVDVTYAGTGRALEYGKNGDVDVITVHSKSREEAFVADGYGVERVPFAYNYFLIVGPKSDPAGLSGLSPEDAFKKLIDNPGSGQFLSRGDNSGTHGKEKDIWASTGYDYDTQIAINSNDSWYLEGGSGMGPTLNNADELEAYTLSDMGTFLAYQGDVDLVPIVESGSILLNVYSAIACTSARDTTMANNMITFLTSDDIQELIGNYGTAQYSQQLFTPCAGNEPIS
ncbi:substrate-binding domain-containing protein [Chloroflexota bacterium]